MTLKLDLYSLLKSLLKLLYEEKEALINNDGLKVAEIVEKKNEYIEKLSQFHEVSPSEQILNIIEEIKTLQETNLLLTKQALSHQNILLESIAKNIKNISNTYSSKGSYNKTNNLGLIDQKV